jgi:hypothetical protein
MSDCKVFRREIGEASERGELSGTAAAHADVCRACGETLHARDAVRGLVRGLGKVEAPADFEFRLRARMAASKGAGRRGPFGGLRLAYRFAPFALAALFLVVSASLYFRQTPRGTTGVSAVATRQVAGNNAGTQSPAPSAHTDSQGSTPAPFAEGEPAYSPKSHALRASVSRQHVAARRATGGVREAAGAALNTTVASVSAAEVIRGRTLSIPMETSASPLRLVLRDERGATRVVPVRSVSFGAQDLIAREGTGRQATAADDEGVW